MTTRRSAYEYNMAPEDVDLDELERLARAATPGPWRAGRVEGEAAIWAKDPTALGGPSLGERLLFRANEHFHHDADRAYVAALCPEAILSLVRLARGRRDGATRVYTARISTRDADALNVTAKSGGDAGRPFAPSWDILRDALDARRAFERNGDVATWEAAWATYTSLFLEQMRDSYRRNRAAWDALLARPRVVLACYCTDPWHCHRTLLATRVLPKLGALYAGELSL